MTCYKKLDMKDINFKSVQPNYTRDVACTRVATRNFRACDTRIKRVSHAFGVELVAGLYRKCKLITDYILYDNFLPLDHQTDRFPGITVA